MDHDPLQEFLDYKAILELKARFVHTVDSKDWDGFRAVFIPYEGVFDFGGGFTVEGGDNFVDAVSEQLTGAVSVHRAFLPQITFLSPTEAKGEWAVNDYLEWPSDPVTGQRRAHQGFGHEYETYRKIEGVWKIAAWRVHYIRMDPMPRAPLPDGFLGGPEVLRDHGYITAVTSPPY
jgi:hypothetical protein